MNVAPVQEDAVDILTKNIVLTLLYIWVTPHKQYGNMFGFGTGRNYFPLLNSRRVVWISLD